MAQQLIQWGAERLGPLYAAYKTGLSLPISPTTSSVLAGYSITTAVGIVVSTTTGTFTATATASATATNGTVTNTVITTTTATFTGTATTTTTGTATATASASAADPKLLAQYIVYNYYDFAPNQGTGARTDLYNALEMIFGLYDGNI